MPLMVSHESISDVIICDMYIYKYWHTFEISYYYYYKVTPVHGTMWENLSFLWPCKMVKKRSRSKQHILCTTSSSWQTVETMIKGQCQMVQWVMVSTKWPPFMIQCGKNSKFSWPGKKVKKRSRSKQQVLCTTSTSWLTVKPWSKVNVKCSINYGVHKVISVNGQCGKIPTFCDLAKNQ